jgi:flagellar hook assembly protein FlgD
MAGMVRNYPNPFSRGTTIFFVTAKPGGVRLEIFDASGRRVRTLLNEFKTAGPHTCLWDGTDAMGGLVRSGVYFYSIRGGGITAEKRMVLVE